eukprot:m.346879 g.346879  ORF g.346879 m.346879 type:complete len:267 (+) comp16144_c0_seq8:769-1569(+)
MALGFVVLQSKYNVDVLDLDTQAVTELDTTGEQIHSSTLQLGPGHGSENIVTWHDLVEQTRMAMSFAGESGRFSQRYYSAASKASSAQSFIRRRDQRKATNPLDSFASEQLLLPSLEDEDESGGGQSVFYDAPSTYDGLSGYLTKLGSFIKSWKRRWFFLDCGRMSLAYYESEERPAPLGTICLSDVTAVEYKNAYNHIQGWFILVHTPRRVWVLRADDQHTWVTWIKALMASCPATAGSTELPAEIQSTTANQHGSLGDIELNFL